MLILETTPLTFPGSSWNLRDVPGSDDDPVLKSPEAARLLGISIDTLIKGADAGEIPCWKTPGGHRRFRHSALVTLMGGEQKAAS